MSADTDAADGANDPALSRALPDWLTRTSDYVPAPDRDSFLRRNVLAMAGALSALRSEPGKVTGVSGLLGGVSPAIRLVGVLLLVGCVSLAHNMAFVWVMVAGLLVLIASMPARSIRAVLGPAVVAACMALVVNLPAVLLGHPSAPVRMVSKTFCTVTLVVHLAHALGPEGTMGALRGMGLPVRAATVVDLALRDIVLLGEEAVTLSESLYLRSVGHNRDKTLSAAGVMGVVFVRAQRKAAERAEAMELRGYGGQWSPSRRSCRLTKADVAYLLLAFLIGASFVYLEGTLA